VFELLEDAFQAQLSLSQEHRTYDEVTSILSPYFSKKYIDLFLEENLYEEKSGFIVYGSDFAMYYVPYFSYSDETKVMYDKKEGIIYVYEYFKANSEGPVTYEEHYEMVILEPTKSSWIIAEVVESKEMPEQIKNLNGSQGIETGVHETQVGIYQYKIGSIYSILELEKKVKYTTFHESAIKNPFAYSLIYTKMVNGPNSSILNTYSMMPD